MSEKPPSDHTASTVAYYDAHAAAFCKRTVTIDTSDLYPPFLREIPPGGRILDAGCGSGRDSLTFLRMGYQVVSIDASAEMVAATTKLTGQHVLQLTFHSVDFDSEFDGIWACASLLHVPRQDLPSVLVRLEKALKPGGVLYCSFKYGDSERMEEERFFNDLNETLLEVILANLPDLELVRVWITKDVRSKRRSQLQWLNAIVRRCSSGGQNIDDHLR